jgi:oligopeptidase B
MRRNLLPAFLVVAVASCTATRPPSAVSVPQPAATPRPPLPPVAAVVPHAVVSPHGTRNDPYYWLRDDTRSKPEVLAYLRAENDYYHARSAEYAVLTKQITAELIGRTRENDSTVPYRYRDYVYAVRFEAGKEYPIRVRTPVAGGGEQVLVDGNVESRGHAFYSLNGSAVSPDQSFYAFTEDTVGRYQNRLRIREIATGRELPDRIDGLSSSLAWAGDGKSIFYVENDPVTLLSKRVRRHVLGSDPKLDPVVHEESDPAYYLSVHPTADRRYVLVELSSTEASEFRLIPADDPTSVPRLFAAREAGHLYDIDHAGGRWVVRTNWQAPDYRLMTVADDAIGEKSGWREVVPAEPGVFLDDFAAFRDHLVIAARREGLVRLRYARWDDLARWSDVPVDEETAVHGFHANPDRDVTTLRYGEGSMTTPDSVYEIDLRTGARTLLKRDEVPTYDAALYESKRLRAPARDGVLVPVSIVFRKGLPRDGSAPLYQYGYGAYGATLDPTFDSTVVSLLDRGFVYAIAHVRGGQELGRAWYEGGRLLHKKNSFTDFIDVTDFLVREKYVAPDKVFASGGSAGGLLMGAVANLAGEKYRGIAAHVPFVDAVTTMLDESIPLVTNEFDEWGNPQRNADYAYLLSYSPYDNVAAKPYPAMLVTTGLHDSQVQYYEPAKWVARLRATKTDSNPLLFKINMEAGHGGRSGRYAGLGEVAEEFAFFIHQLR